MHLVDQVLLRGPRLTSAGEQNRKAASFALSAFGGNTVLLPLGLMGVLHPLQWALLALIGLLLFGKHLPKASRLVGRSVWDLKNGLAELVGLGHSVDESREHRGRGQGLAVERKRDRLSGSASQQIEAKGD